MKTKLLRPLLAATLALGLCQSAFGAPAKAKAKPKPAAVAAAPLRLQATAASKVSVKGDSTMHKWESLATELTITAELAAGKGSLIEAIQQRGLKALQLEIAVAGLRNDEKSAKMDSNTQKAMEAEQFPLIRFVMSGYEIKGDEVAARGSLTIHGVSKDVELKGKLAPVEQGVEVQGSFDILMSDYGVKPPVMMLGTIRVKDALSIAYDYTLAAKP